MRCAILFLLLGDEIMKVITITGSMKFARQMKDIARKLEDQKIME